MATMTERIIEAFGGVSKHTLEALKAEMTTQAQAMATRAYEAGMYDAAGGNDEPPNGTLRSYGYRRATTATLRDFASMPPDKVLSTIWTQWQSSPIAKRVIKIKRGYVLGKGIEPHSEDEDLENVLQEFWTRNNFHQDGRRANEFTEQLFLFGEQLYPAFVRESDGAVLIAYFDPSQIERVVMHPDNALETCAVILKEAQPNSETPWEGERKRQVYRVIRVAQAGEYQGKLITSKQAFATKQVDAWETSMLKHYGLTEYSGDVFLTQINKVSNQPRGYSDLLQVADWIDQADRTLFALADREQMAGYFFIDVAIDGDENAVKAAAARSKQKPPSPGGANFHNLAENWTVQQPDLKQEGSIATLVALLTFIMGGMGFPVSWYGYGSDTNRATLEAQGDPTYRQLEDDQGVVRSMFLGMLTFARDQAEIAGKWTPTEDGAAEITLNMPEMTTKDLSRVMGLFTPLVNALLALKDARQLSDETVQKAVAKVLKEMDIDTSPEEEMRKLVDNETDAAQADNDKLNAALDQLNKTPNLNQEM